MPSRSLEIHRKAQAERLQAILHDLLMEEENKYCADCDAKQPRWASWNLGVFVCIRCAGIHRSIGVQVSKVKSVNLDSWTPEQVQSMRVMGNAKAKAVYEAELPRDYRRPQTEQQLEMFIRAKYEQKRYILRDWQPPKVDVADLIPALEKGQHRSSFKRNQSSKTSDNGLCIPSVFPAKSPPSKLQSSAPAPIIDMQLLDFSDTAPTSSSDSSGQKTADCNSLSLFNDNSGGGDISAGIAALHIAEKSDGVVDEELEDMFGPIVSAPRAESHSEPPGDTNSVALNPSFECNIQQSASSTNLGDLASLNTSMTIANKKSNADILALFGSEPLVRPAITTQAISQFSQNMSYDTTQSTVSAQRPQFRYPLTGAFPTCGVSYAPNGSLQAQQQFSLAPNNSVMPSVAGVIGNFMNTETFAMFAAASPFANTGGPIVAPSNLLGTTIEPSSNSAIQSAISTATSNMNIGLPLASNSVLDSNKISVDSSSANSLHSSMDQWPSLLEGSTVQKISPLGKSAKNDGNNKKLSENMGHEKDPFASLDNCFANFEQFNASSDKNTGGSRVETASAQNASLWD